MFFCLYFDERMNQNFELPVDFEFITGLKAGQ